VKKQQILGITALVAVVGFTLVATACNFEDTEQRSVTFTNKTAISINIGLKGLDPVELEAATMSKDVKKTVKQVGKDIVLQTITFGNDLVNADPNAYIITDGNLIPGKKGKEVIGIPLATGELIFKADTTVRGNPAIFKISVIQADE